MLSLSKAAKLAGVSKATIHRAVKSGRISAVRQQDGSYLIDPASVDRLYPLILGSDDGETTETDTSRAKPKRPETTPTSAFAAMAAELSGARQLIETLRRQVDDLRVDRDAWRQQAGAAQRLLTLTRDVAPRPTPSGRSFWKRSEDDRPD